MRDLGEITVEDFKRRISISFGTYPQMSRWRNLNLEIILTIIIIIK